MLVFFSIIKLSDLCYERNNRQHLILVHLDNITIHIYIFDQNLSSTTMLDFWLFITCLWTEMHLEVYINLIFLYAQRSFMMKINGSFTTVYNVVKPDIQ